jgi:predicted nucleic-acid-binding protein
VIGLDTNLLLRWLILPDQGDLGSSEAELARVTAIILDSAEPFFVNTIVIAETAWILEQKLKVRRRDVAGIVDRLLYSENVVVGDEAAVRAAHAQYEASSANFADCLFAQLNLAAGCAHTLTFDRKAGRTPGFRHAGDQGK